MPLPPEFLKPITTHAVAGFKGLNEETAISLLKDLPKKSMEAVLHEITYKEPSVKVIDLSQSHRARHGLTFAVENHDGTGQLIRLYIPSHLEYREVGRFINKLHPGHRLALFGKRFQARHELTGTLNSQTSYYATAEIAVRAIAHRHDEQNHPQPTLLWNQDGAIVGLSLSFSKPIVTSNDFKIELKDRFFDIQDTLGPSADLPQTVLKMYADLKELNISPYIESFEDARGMLLLDNSGNFATFNRLAYIV